MESVFSIWVLGVALTSYFIWNICDALFVECVILNFGHRANILSLSLNAIYTMNWSIRPVTERNSYFIEIIIIIRMECPAFGAQWRHAWNSNGNFVYYSTRFLPWHRRPNVAFNMLLSLFYPKHCEYARL